MLPGHGQGRTTAQTWMARRYHHRGRQGDRFCDFHSAEGCSAQTGVKVSAGDAVFIRTGRWAMREAKGPGEAFAGLHASCARWLHDRGVAVLGGDADPEVIPSEVEGVGAPIHMLALVAMGLPLFDE